MNEVERLIGSIADALRRALTLPGCRHDWLWTVCAVGALIALSPIVGAMLVALIRKGTGNRYTVATGSTFAVVGLLFAFAVPWVAFKASGNVFAALANGQTVDGVRASTAASLAEKSCLIKDQRQYLGDPQTVADLLRGHGSSDHPLLFALVIGLPIAAALCVLFEARIAVRRGPRWPLLFLLIPFLVMAVLTGPMPARVIAQLWLGFVPAAFVGVLAVLIIGRPRWSVINRSGADRRPEPQPAYQPQYQPEPAAYTPPVQTPPPAPQQQYLEPTARLDQPTESTVPAPAPAPIEDRFRRIRTLGTGGFGTVWLALDTALDRTVAVKYAHAPDAEAEERMRREARALAAVHHPNCVRIYDIVTERDGLGLVMEYIEGMSLYDAVRRTGGLDDAAAARLWLTMADALAAAHEKGVLHRDVKPTNILLDRGGWPHLIDFGIARAGNDMTLTAAGMLVGTPEYIAPEIARGAPASPASDAWQLAATVHYALTGHSPRGRAGTPTQAMAAAYAQPELQISHDTDHARLLEVSLQADPQQRPSLQTVRDQLERYVRGSGHRADDPITTEIIIDDDATRPIS
ncbi:MAG TPA: serine/threonine-protein kinase [Mycobacteriales bacterium]|nr:serine/threonine-protein kinase [Mycobacteriales bacterium]